MCTGTRIVRPGRHMARVMVWRVTYQGHRWKSGILFGGHSFRPLSSSLGAFLVQIQERNAAAVIAHWQRGPPGGVGFNQMFAGLQSILHELCSNSTPFFSVQLPFILINFSRAALPAS